MLAGGSVIGNNSGIIVTGAGASMVTIAGEVTGWSSSAVFAQGGSNVVTVASTGRVVGAEGVLFGSAGTGANQVINNGLILSYECRRDRIAGQTGTFVLNTGTVIAATGGTGVN